MHVSLKKTIVVCGVEGNRVTFQIAKPRSIRQIGVVVEDDRLASWRFASSRAKTCKFVGVDPQAGKFNFLIQLLQHVFPILGGVGVEEVRVDGPAYSHFAEKRVSSVQISDIDFHLEPSFIEGAFVLDAGVDYRNPPGGLEHSFHLAEGKFGFVDCEDLALNHIVEIAPDGIKGKVVIIEVVDDPMKSAHVFIAPATLMVAEAPKRRDGSLLA
jgi:hypothetical protein